MRKFYVIGGIFPKSQLEVVTSFSKGPIQNAANAYQHNLLEGFDAVSNGEVEIFNLPFVGSYPRRFSKMFFPPCNDFVFTKTKISGIEFFNLSIAKHFSRYYSLLRVLRGRDWGASDVLIVYSMHLPFIAAAIALKKAHPNIRICLIIPDLPEFMSDSPNLFYKFFKWIDSALLKKCMGRIDCFVVLTNAMVDRLGINPLKAIVIEGVASENSNSNIENIVDSPKKSILYSGTLAGRYGIRDLIDAFMEIEGENYELLVCGDGDAKQYVCDAAHRDRRIKYLGQLERTVILDLQRRSWTLVNPRTSDGEYTKYSFPSKIIEYMLSGRPVVMHRLEGIPSEYYDNCFLTETSDGLGLKNCLLSVLEMNSLELSAFGNKARKFVLENKSSTKQVRRIMGLIESIEDEK